MSKDVPIYVHHMQPSGRSFFLQLCEGPLSKLCLDNRVPGNELRDVLGNVVRWYASSLLGSYIHQELI